MSAQVLLNLLNEFRLRDKMRGSSSILSLFSQRLNSIIQEQELSLLIHQGFFAVKTSRLCHLLSNVTIELIMLPYYCVNH